ncbi:DUF4019 domain-containing protein [Paraburkholderia humisilvae]
MACLLATNASVALAQKVQQPGTSAEELISDADTVIKEIDAGNYAEVWKGMAPFVRAQETQSDFVSRVRQARQTMGPVAQRGWTGVNRVVIRNTQGVPDGLYANVDYVTSLASGRVVPEHLSFHLENGRWYLTGYVPQLAPRGPAANGAPPAGANGAYPSFGNTPAE